MEAEERAEQGRKGSGKKRGDRGMRRRGREEREVGEEGRRRREEREGREGGRGSTDYCKVHTNLHPWSEGHQWSWYGYGYPGYYYQAVSQGPDTVQRQNHMIGMCCVCD